jgi:hypothetical protein
VTFPFPGQAAIPTFIQVEMNSAQRKETSYEGIIPGGLSAFMSASRPLEDLPPAGAFIPRKAEFRTPFSSSDEGHSWTSTPVPFMAVRGVDNAGEARWDGKAEAADRGVGKVFFSRVTTKRTSRRATRAKTVADPEDP